MDSNEVLISFLRYANYSAKIIILAEHYNLYEVLFALT